MPGQATIICPYCHKEIPLTDAISNEVKEKIREELNAEALKKEQEIAQKEQALSAKEKELEGLKKSMEEKVAQTLKQEREKIEKEAKQKAEESVGVEFKDLRSQIEEKDKKLAEAQQQELDLRKKARELEDAKRAFELEVTRKLDEERGKIREAVAKSLTEEYRLKEAEKEKQISDMKRQIDELKRKAEQGSQQLQGEVLEIQLEEILKAHFPDDQIEPVPKGIRGADVLQKVQNQFGQYCGTIIWESKRTKNWNSGWIDKLKENQREINAEIAVLLTEVLPSEVRNFAYVTGVWITDYSSVLGLATVLRMSLVQVAMTKLATTGRDEKMAVLYDYLCSSEFRQKVEAIVEAFVAMKRDLDGEKRSMEKIWGKREKQIERVIKNTVGMYGNMQGIIGASLPQIKGLELEALTAGEGSEESDGSKAEGE